MLQQLLIAALFITALVYVGQLMYKAFQAKTACSTGCAKCGAVDFAKIEAEISKRGRLPKIGETAKNERTVNEG